MPELVQSCRVHGIVILYLYSLFFGPLSPLQAALADLRPVNFARYRLGSVTKVLAFGASSSGRVGFTFSLCKLYFLETKSLFGGAKGSEGTFWPIGVT